MQPNARTLITLAAALLLLAIGAYTLVRPPSATAPAPSAKPSVAREARALSGGTGESAARTPADEPAGENVQLAPVEHIAPIGPASQESGVLGLVLDDSTGNPLERFEVLHSPAGAGRARVSTLLGYEDSEPAASETFEGSHGRFELPGLDAGSQSLCAFAEGYERSEPVVPGKGEEIVIRLRRGAVVRGRVLDPSGIAVKGALVAWIDYRGETRTGPRERFERTDELGRFVLGSVPLSARRILAGREDLGEGVSERLALEPGVPAREVVIELVRRGS